MYELGLPDELHIAIPPRTEPRELLILTIGTLGDVAANLNDVKESVALVENTQTGDVEFSARFFDAFLQSHFSDEIARDTALLAASAYYLARRPGSSLVMARRLKEAATESPVEVLLRWLLVADFTNYPSPSDPFFGSSLQELAKLVAFHFFNGSGAIEIDSLLTKMRYRAYRGAPSWELLLIDIIAAVVRLRITASAWTCLPGFTGIGADSWASAINRPEFPKELWPSQILLGKEGIFSGSSGVVQMPTSAGKTRSVEIVLRSAFLSNRTSLAVVVAPFRALSHEIGTWLRHAFRNDSIKVNELSDAMQMDIFDELLGVNVGSTQNVLVVTPEKLLYILRQNPNLVHEIGVVIYDEGHQFDSGSRGISYELLLTQIKTLLSPTAQTLLISAVIQNADSIGQWLIGDDARTVNGTATLPTARAVAFASWIETLGQLMFFETEKFVKPDYFVPRVIEKHQLARIPREKSDRFFPEEDAKDVSLYLGLRLVSQGAVAIFCGRKDTASSIAARAVDVYRRSFSIPAPGTIANRAELARLQALIEAHFGTQSHLRLAAGLGIFVHHGTTPQGLRLSIEHAMQKSLINFVVCTSTLAQGVNLPIRYLIVSSTRQAGEKIKVRDFQNLIGRAGRSGMHTEGLVIFSDPDIFDKRNVENWRFEESVGLLSPDKAEITTSSLLALLDPVTSNDGKGVIQLSAVDLWQLLLQGESGWLTWSTAVVRNNSRFNFEAKRIVSDLRRRRKELATLESYLMANRGNASFEDFAAGTERLASATLAYHLADEDTKPEIVALFTSVADYVERVQPSPVQQLSYSKTLLGVDNAMFIEKWVNANRQTLLELKTNQEWLNVLWQLFSDLTDDKFFHSVEPDSIVRMMASMWIEGSPYSTLIANAVSVSATKPWGEEQRRRLTDDDIVGFFEHTISFDCSLIVAAVSQFLFGDEALDLEEAQPLQLLQKSLKYGLPNRMIISCHEAGFADRVLAQQLCERLREAGYAGETFSSAIDEHRDIIEAVLSEYPSYFSSVLAGLS